MMSCSSHPAASTSSTKAPIRAATTPTEPALARISSAAWGWAECDVMTVTFVLGESPWRCARVIVRPGERQHFCILVAYSPKFAIETLDGFGALAPRRFWRVGRRDPKTDIPEAAPLDRPDGRAVRHRPGAARHVAGVPRRDRAGDPSRPDRRRAAGAPAGPGAGRRLPRGAPQGRADSRRIPRR